MAKLTWQEKRELNRCFGFLLLIALLFGLLFLFAGLMAGCISSGSGNPMRTSEGRDEEGRRSSCRCGLTCKGV